MTSRFHRYAELFKSTGPWCTVYTDISTGTVDSLHAIDVLPENICRELEQQGASKADLAAVEAAVRPAEGVPDPVCRYLLVRDGTVEIDEVLPGPLAGRGVLEVGEVPDLTPLFRHRPDDFPYVVAEVGRDGGEICLEYASRARALDEQQIEGETEHLKKFPGGGWSQGRWQRHTEDVWRRNTEQVAEQIDKVVAGSGAQLVVLAGDLRARGLVEEQLSKAARALVSVVDANTRAEGSQSADFAHQVEGRVAEVIAHRQHELLERLAEQRGRPDPTAVSGIEPVVAALQQAQAETLLIDDTHLDAEQELLALDAEPWIAVTESEAVGARVLGRVPADAALVRAAVLTDGRPVFVPPGALPDSTDVAALLRWSAAPAG
ncbi:Vms1/Ankzf1 family peptidyl-tRNA hydrolase [Kocuria oceani]|uniref:Vms1/Ankzf1 family peptidyl-tRNA hydrolase n=1 Tax=Kocuria oceani TaxID=988827 RepID=A0ABV9TGL3_9MICC|nr:Vms1/Ankzf1 family peptidyl-tRNA hydrolase [Kocuria oceani]